MESIALPKKIKFKKGKTPNEGKIYVEPCFPGYGITLGNSLRRVLLSSLPGAAAIGVKIKGIDHEFMPLPHLKEDILEFILNLKKLRLKIHSEEDQILELDVHGKKDVTAGDIKANRQEEIVNPELVLGTITDMAGNLSAEIHVTKGMGYVTIESREEKVSQIGFMEMDSIFSPVLKAGIEIENVRVGKMTNWDRLVIDIKTDGTITPEEAFNDSIQILIKQFTALDPNQAPKKDDKEEEKTKGETEDKTNESETKDEGEKEVKVNSEGKESVLGKKETKKRGRPKKS